MTDKEIPREVANKIDTSMRLAAAAAAIRAAIHDYPDDPRLFSLLAPAIQLDRIAQSMLDDAVSGNQEAVEDT